MRWFAVVAGIVASTYSCSSPPPSCPPLDAAIADDAPPVLFDSGIPDAFTPDAPQCAPPKTSGSASRGFQIDVAHSGAQPTDTLTLPLCQRWVANVDGRASYAAIDHGRVFLLSGVGSEIVWLYAFDAHTGTPLWGPVTLDYAVGMAEDDDVVFVVNLFGKVQAFAGGTGQQLWEAQLGFGSTQASPTAVGGRVYVAGAGQTTYALDEKSGAIVWSQYPSFVLQTPTIVGSSLLEGDGTARAISLDTNDGGIAWKFTGTQSGGSIDTTAAYGGRLYSPGESGGIFDQASGKLLGIFASDHVPAFGKQLVFYVQDPNVVAVDLASSKILWTFDPAVRVTLPPITIGDVVVVATEVGQIFVLDATSGKTLATDNIGTSIPPNFSGSLVGGLTAAGGMLFVGGDGRIVAY